MKKHIVIAAGLTLTLLSGCSEDGQLQEIGANQSMKPSSMVTKESNTLATATPDATQLSATLGNGGEGWAEGDNIWTYSLESMNHNSYELTSGAGSTVAEFSRTEGSDDYQGGGTVYAVSSTKNLYGLAATANGGVQLTATIPNSYEAEEVGAREGCSRMPVPFWGIAAFGSDGRLVTEMNGLTALLKVNVATLPADTRALVLTTHSYTDLIDAETAPEEGDGKPLSGTFEAVLEQGAQLAANPIFYSYDTLRVNLTGASAYRHLYIPVVSASYQALHVIAVTGDSRYAYEWQGRVLKTYRQDAPFRANTIVALEPESTGIRTPRINR